MICLRVGAGGFVRLLKNAGFAFVAVGNDVGFFKQLLIIVRGFDGDGMRA